MWMRKYVGTVLAVGFVLSPLLRVRSATPQQWEAVESQLWREIPEDDSFSPERGGLLKLPTVDDFAQKKDLAFFNEMIAQSDDPLVMLCGYQLIQKYYPEQAFRAGCQMMTMLTKHPAFLWLGIVVQDLEKTPSNSAQLRAQFSEVLRSVKMPYSIPLIAALPRDFLDAWWTHEPRDVLAENEACVADWLLSDTRSLKDTTRDSVRQRIQAYREMPGFPRLIYLADGKPPEADVALLLRGVLEDTKISDLLIVGLARKYRSAIVTMNLATLKVSPERSSLLKRALKLP